MFFDQKADDEILFSRSFEIMQEIKDSNVNAFFKGKSIATMFKNDDYLRLEDKSTKHFFLSLVKSVKSNVKVKKKRPRTSVIVAHAISAHNSCE